MKSPSITWISSDDPPDSFPDIESAFEVPDGLLAAGGDLSPERLIVAYRNGIFPWYDDEQPILWWSPDPRCVLRPHEFHVSRRLRRSLSRGSIEVSFNQSFDEVIAACAADRAGQQGTWITSEMAAAYCQLHRDGWAHSIEIWQAGQLAGGLYGLSIGGCFFGESMFSRQNNASKAAMLALCRQLVDHDFEIFDCQIESPHLISLGATLISRPRFAAILRRACSSNSKFSDWPAGRRQVAEFLS